MFGWQSFLFLSASNPQVIWGEGVGHSWPKRYTRRILQKSGITKITLSDKIWNITKQNFNFHQNRFNFVEDLASLKFGSFPWILTLGAILLNKNVKIGGYCRRLDLIGVQTFLIWFLIVQKEKILLNHLWSDPAFRNRHLF